MDARCMVNAWTRPPAACNAPPLSGPARTHALGMPVHGLRGSAHARTTPRCAARRSGTGHPCQVGVGIASHGVACTVCPHRTAPHRAQVGLLLLNPKP